MRKSQARTGHRPLKVVAAAAFATAAVLASTAVPAYAATFTLSTSQVAVAGGTVLYLSGGTFLNTNYIRFALSSNSCPTLYTTSQTGAVDGGAVTAVGGGTTAYVTTPALPAGTYKPCLYVDSTTGGAHADTTAATVTAVNVAALAPTTGVSADKVTLTAGSGIFTLTTYSTEFVSGVTACPSTYTTASSTAIVGVTAKTSTTVLTVTVPSTLVVGTPYYICSYVGASAGSSALAARSNVTFASFATTLPPLTVAPSGGSSGVATTVTVSVPTTSAVFTGTPDVLVTRNSCPLVRPADAALGATTLVEPYEPTVTKISNSKLAVTMPTTVIVGGMDVTTAWNICTYASTSTSAVLLSAPAVYYVAPVLDVSGAQYAVGSGSAAGTGSGPAQGGSQITVSSLTGIPTATGAILSATLGGSPINITAVNSSTSFTGTTSAHAAGAVKLAVTTSAGTKTTTTSPYTYTYGITVSPNTAATNTSPVLDITGAGFGSLSFGTVTDTVALAAGTSYVLLTNNTWNAQDFTSALDAQAVKAVSFCNGVLPISDTEIICTLDLTQSIASVATNAPTFQATDVPAGTYTMTVVNSGEDLLDTDYNYSIVSSGSTFTVAPY